MPLKRWRHSCGCYSEDNLSLSPDCSRCGEPGEYDGMRLTAHEAMSAHMKVYGLLPMGRHFRYEQAVRGPLIRRCEVCDGSGTVEIPWLVWSDRPLCNRTGLVPNVPREKITEARQKVLARYPNAAAPWE